MSDDEEVERLQNWHDVWDSIAEIKQASVNNSISFSQNKSKINLTILYDKICSLDKKISLIEDKLDQISSDVSLAINNKPPSNIIYKPFYNKESYVSSQNFCYLCNDNLTFRIVIMSDSDSMILYPFGKQRINKEYQNWSYPALLKNDEDEVIGNIELNFKLHNGIYILTLERDVYETENNDKIFLSEVQRPFSITFENKLS